MRKRGGFTLMESIIAIAVLSIMLLSFTLMVSTSSNFNNAASARQEELSTALDFIYNGEATGRGTLTVETGGGSVSREVEFRTAAGGVTLYSFSLEETP